MKTKYLLCSIFAVFFAISAYTPVVYADVETDYQVYSKQRSKLKRALFLQFYEHYKKSFPLLKELAQNNDPVAAFYYAEALHNGWGVFPPNRQKAGEIFAKVIEDISALRVKQDGLISYTLYRAYDKGYGREENKGKAYYWLDNAIAQGYGIAYYDRAKLLEEAGHNIEALAMYKKAAELGTSEAYFRLGLIYERGETGIKQNYPEALNYYSKAAAEGHTKAEANLGAMYYNGLGTKQNYAEALRLFQKAAAKDNPAAINNLALMTLKGEGGLSADKPKALKLFHRAALFGDDNALKNLGNMHYKGIGIKANPEKAFKYYLLSAQKNNPDAMYKVAIMYEQGIGISKNAKEAEYWKTVLSEAGYDTAKLNGL